MLLLNLKLSVAVDKAAPAQIKSQEYTIIIIIIIITTPHYTEYQVKRLYNEFLTLKGSFWFI